MTSSVLLVSRLDRSIEFYRQVFSCTVTIREHGAALLLAPDGFQIYLIARGTRAEHPSGGIGSSTSSGPWTATPQLRDIAQALQDRVGRTYGYTQRRSVLLGQPATQMASGSWWPIRARRRCPARSWPPGCTHEAAPAGRPRIDLPVLASHRQTPTPDVTDSLPGRLRGCDDRVDSARRPTLRTTDLYPTADEVIP